jgi:hypothetical protein
MAVTYDRQVIHGVADSLYRRAAGLTLWYGLVGGFGSLITLAVVLSALRLSRGGGMGGTEMALIFFPGLLFGSIAGHGRATNLRLQAQTLLCQAEMCEHMRRVANCLGGYADG